MSSRVRSIMVFGSFQAIALIVCLAPFSTVQADDDYGLANPTREPVANGTVRGTANSAVSDDAVSAWLDEAVPESRESGRLVRRPVAKAKTESGPQALTTGTTSPSRFQLMWPLLTVLAMIGGAVFLFRKFVPRSNRLGRGGAIGVLSNHYLSNKQSLCLVRLGHRLVLVGVTPERISAVMEISDPVEMAEIVASVESKKEGSFTSVLSRFGNRDLPKEPARESVEEDSWIPTERLAKTGTEVRDLVDRIRALSGPRSSAEPT